MTTKTGHRTSRLAGRLKTIRGAWVAGMEWCVARLKFGSFRGERDRYVATDFVPRNLVYLINLVHASTTSHRSENATLDIHISLRPLVQAGQWDSGTRYVT